MLLVRMGLLSGLVCRSLGVLPPLVLPFPPRVGILLSRLVLCLQRDSICHSRQEGVLAVVVHVTLVVPSAAVLP